MISMPPWYFVDTKEPDETIDWICDFSGKLGEPGPLDTSSTVDEITGIPAVTINPTDLITVGDPILASGDDGPNTAVGLWLQGGTDGQEYAIHIACQTVGGRKPTKTFYLTVKAT